MSAATTSKADWLERIERGRETWEAVVAEVGDAWMDRPGATGDWTFKDVAGHLNGWRELTVDRLEAAAGDQAPPRMPWPDDLSEETEEGVEAINRWFYARSRERPATEILAESREQFRRMRAAVEAVPEDELVTPGRFPWLGGEPLSAPLSAVLDGSLGHLHEDHEPEIRAWLAGQPR
ncbi:MAG: ClbS/DfsB family four-helix bundle protein [Thermomicrobiales bacterium]